jgi:hypothetical protein
LAPSIQASTIMSQVACAPAASVEVANPMGSVVAIPLLGGFDHQYARMA